MVEARKLAPHLVPRAGQALGVACLLGLLAFVGFGAWHALGSYQNAQALRSPALAREPIASPEREAAARALAEAARQGEELRQGLPPPAECEAAYDVAGQFLQHVQADRLAEAFAMTRSAARPWPDAAAFKQFLGAHPGLKRPLVPFGMMRPEVPGEKLVRLRFVSLANQRTRVEVKITLGRNQIHWEIDDIEVREHQARP